MKLRRLVLTILGAVPALPSPVLAQAYPTKSIRLVLPFAAGSAVDVLARFYGQKMSETWKQQVVIDNRTGANGIIGTEIAARAPADGYTLYMGNVATLAINPGLYAKLPFDVARDFAPITLVAAINNCLIVHPSLPVKSVKELIAFAKARPGQLNYASGGVGSAQHIPMEMLKSMTGIDIVHVAYKGLTPAFNDVVAGQVPMMVPGVVTALPFHLAGRIRIIATTATRRAAATPTFLPSPNPACPASNGIHGPVSWRPPAHPRRPLHASTRRPCALRGFPRRRRSCPALNGSAAPRRNSRATSRPTSQPSPRW